MKSTEVTNRLKEITGQSTNEGALEAIEGALRGGAAPPLGITVVISPSGGVFSALIGIEAEPTAWQLRTIKAAARAAEDWLDQALAQAYRAEASTHPPQGDDPDTTP